MRINEFTQPGRFRQQLYATIPEMKQTEVTQPHLYLDMDGVQADFFTAWAKWHGQKVGDSNIERYKQIGDKAQREASIAELNQAGPEFIQRFFATLPTLPGGMHLVSWVRQHNIPFTVLSSPLRGNHEASIAGKKTWLERHVPSGVSGAIFADNKERWAKKGTRPNVLVDDYKKNIQAWRAAGGIGILYRDDNVEDVINQLEQIYGVK